MAGLVDIAALVAYICKAESIAPEDLATPTPGSHPLFDASEFAARMVVPDDWSEGDAYPEYKGIATSIFAFQLLKDAVPGAPVSTHDVLRYRQDNFASLKPHAVPKWKCPVAVAITEEDVAGFDPKRPQFRKISMDVPTYAFLQELHDRLVRAPVDGYPAGFVQAARHVPVNCMFFPPSPALEEHIYVSSLQIMEDFRIAEEAHAPRAWQLCQMWALGRDMKQRAGAAQDDSAAAVAEMLTRVRCSKNCDYADKGIIQKRHVQDALNVHDRVLAAGVGDLLERAGATFGPRSPLTSMSKLVKLSQAVQATAASRKSSPGALLGQVVRVMFLRMELSLAEDGLTALSKTEIPRCILISDLLAEAAARVNCESEPEAVQNAVASLGTSVPRPSEVESVCSLTQRPSLRAGLCWAAQVLQGSLDAVLREIVHADFKKATAKQMLLHGKLAWVSDVQPKLDAEAEADQRRVVASAVAARAGIAEEDVEDFAAGVLEALSSQPAALQPPLASALVAAADPGCSAESAAAVITSASVTHAEARAQHAREVLAERLRLGVCPPLDAPVGDWQAAMDKLIAGFFDIARSGFQLHAWVLDAASDAEPVLHEGEAINSKSPVLSKLLAERFFKAAGRSAKPEQSYALLAPARDPGSKKMLSKLLTEEPFEASVADHVNIIYKESAKGRGPRRSRVQLLEPVLCFASRTSVTKAAETPPKKRNRLHYTSTSVLSDCIVHAPLPDVDQLPRLTVELKAKILSPGGLLRTESAETKAMAECTLLHHEKCADLWSEVLHHFRVSTLMTATPGSGTMLKAAIGMGISVAALCKNEDHKAFLEQELASWAVSESSRPGTWCFASAGDLSTRFGIAGSMSDEDGGDEGEEQGESEEGSGGSDEETADEASRKPAKSLAEPAIAKAKSLAKPAVAEEELLAEPAEPAKTKTAAAKATAKSKTKGAAQAAAAAGHQDAKTPTKGAPEQDSQLDELNSSPPAKRGRAAKAAAAAPAEKRNRSSAVDKVVREVRTAASRGAFLPRL